MTLSSPHPCAIVIIQPFTDPAILPSSIAASPAAASPAASPAPSSPVPPGPPPWKLHRARAAAGLDPPGSADNGGGGGGSGNGGSFPDVEIFTPYGSELSRRERQPSPLKPSPSPLKPSPQRQRAQGEGQKAPVPRPPSGGARDWVGHFAPPPAIVPLCGTSPLPVKPPPSSPSVQAVAVWAKRGKTELLEVLSQIQDVLAEEGDGEDGDAGWTPTAASTPPKTGLDAPRRSPLTAADGPPRRAPPGGAGGLRLPPELGEEEAPSGRPGGSGKSSSTAATGGGGRGHSAAAATNSHKVESLRVELEQALGSGRFLEAYRYLREVQQRAGGEEAAEDGGAGIDETQGTLERALGAKLHLARMIHRLITLEDSVFD